MITTTGNLKLTASIRKLLKEDAETERAAAIARWQARFEGQALSNFFCEIVNLCRIPGPPRDKLDLIAEKVSEAYAWLETSADEHNDRAEVEVKGIVLNPKLKPVEQQ
jgi:hypothetical protein